MSYRKFSADFIFTGYEFAPPEQVLVTDESGTIVDIVGAANAGDDILHLEGLLAPGFINGHCHLELSHMKGKVPEGTGLVEFLIKVIRERAASSEEITAAMQAAEEEMLESGIVAVADICNTAFSVPIKSASSVHWRNFIEVLGFTEINAEKRLEDAQKVLDAFTPLNKPTRRVKSSLTPHAPFSVSSRLFSLINEKSTHERISIHSQESRAEEQLFKTRGGDMFRLYENLNIDASFFEATGKSSLASFLPLLNKASGIILVHNTYLSKDDIQLLASRQSIPEIYFCLCPGANKYIESTMPPVDLLTNFQNRIILGTDSYASNWQLNILEEIKLIHSAFPEIRINSLLQWATINGALALEMDGLLGSFEIGKKPGLVLIEGMTPNALAKNAVSKRIL